MQADFRTVAMIFSMIGTPETMALAKISLTSH